MGYALRPSSSKSGTDGVLQWQRAETLGALINGVFLVALCLSIFLEAIQRFVEPQEVSKPLLVLIVGCCGLLSNILGLFLFHDHGHSHGGSGHSHGHAHDTTSAAEDGQSREILDQSGNIVNVLPTTVVAAQEQHAQLKQQALATSPPTSRKVSGGTGSRRHKRLSSGSRNRFRGLVAEDNIHPASFRNSIIAASRMDSIDSAEDSDSEHEEALARESAIESSPLLTKSDYSQAGQRSASRDKIPADRQSNDHSSHKHAQPKEEEKAGHSHGDLNMRGLFLHVLGDALGNVGVIVSALIIWRTPYWWRFYADPLVSLIITVIILASAIPLVKAASRILLQAVPAGIDVGDIQDDVMELPGVVNCHHVHVWQLNDTKLISSLHVVVGYDFKGEGSARYMKLAQCIRECLHAYGIHSSTIQPEFHLTPAAPCVDGGADGSRSSTPHDQEGSGRLSVRSDMPHACLLDCGDECADGTQCCTRSPTE